MATIPGRTRHLIATTAEWASFDPFVLGSGELGIEIKTDGSKWVKIGDGVTSFASLTYLMGYPLSPVFDSLQVTGLLEAGHIHGSLAGNLYIHVKNVSGETLPKGTPFYISGTVGASDRVEIQKAVASDSSKGPVVGLLDTTLLPNGEGNGVIAGEIFDYDTFTPGWITNQRLYLGVSGGLTSTRPTSGSSFTQIVSYAGRIHQTTGTLIVLHSAPEPVAGTPGDIQINSNNGFGFVSGFNWDSVNQRINVPGGGLFTGGLGYAATVDGGTVTQPTAKTDSVTMNALKGLIVMNAAALNTATSVSFDLINNQIGSKDFVLVRHYSAGATGSYTINTFHTANPAPAGSVRITVRNVSAASLSQGIVLQFMVIKG